MSAFRGKNLETGAIRAFRDAVADGIVAQGSFLLIENLDRFSRTDPLDAVFELREVCREGVGIVTLTDGKVYTADGLTRDHMSLLIAIVTAMRANEESRWKAQRLKAAWAGKRQKAAERKLTARAPGWLRLSPDRSTFEVIEERAEVVRRIFDMTLQGIGQHSIAERLNGERVPTFSGGLYWHRSTIFKLLNSPTVMGTYVPHILDHDASTGKTVRKPQDPIEGYYPAVVDAETFQTVQAMQNGFRAPKGPGHNAVANVLAGLARCPVCGGSMRRVNKGSGRKGGRPKLVCSAAKSGAGCTYRTVDYIAVEQTLVANAVWLVEHAPSKDASLDTDLANARSHLETVEQHIERTVEALLSMGSSDTLTGKLRALETEKAETKAKIEELEHRLAGAESAVLNKRLETFEAALEARELGKANAALRAMVSGVVVDYRTGDLMLQWKHDGETRLSFGLPIEEHAERPGAT